MRGSRLLLVLTVVAVLGLVFAVGCGDDDETTTTTADVTGTTAGAGEAADGETVFANTCASCHGGDGTGGTAPDLTALSLDQDRVADQVRNGGGAMPAYGDRLSDEEIDAVANYVTEDIMQ